VKKLNVQDLIFIDESGVNLAMVRLYAREVKRFKSSREPNQIGVAEMYRYWEQYPSKKF
jgi:hypothetical protein